MLVKGFESAVVMINSMTGYGNAEGHLNGATYAVEIKTVNNRYFKTSIKLPDPVAFLEEDIDELLRRNMSRGMVNYVLQIKGISADATFDIDETALRAYAGKLIRIAAEMKIDCPIDIGNLLMIPGMLAQASGDEEKTVQVRKTVLDITQQAIDRLMQMRTAEGAALAADLNVHCEAIRKDLEQIRSRSPVVVREYHDKLRKRVDELLAVAKLKLDEETLAREIAIFAERSDISEEIARLDSHLQQFTQSCRTEGQAGRRLDFISQEMLREVNTIASKASDTEIIHWVVDMKCWIDRIKEQVQNIE